MANEEQKEVIDECIKEMANMEGKKSARILKLAEDLAKHGMKEKEICASIKKAFRESQVKVKTPEGEIHISRVVTDSYINFVLPKKYKDDSKTRLDIKNKKEESQTAKALLVASTDGKSHTETAPKETPLSDTARFKQIVQENVNLKAENQQFKAITENKNPIVTDLQKHGFNLSEKHPYYYKGSASQVIKMITEQIGKDKNADHQYNVLLMRVADKIGGSTKTVPV